MSGTATESAVAERAYVLTALDRCDSCGAQAYVKAVLATGGELLFCSHHGRKVHDKLRPVATSWIDETERLLDGRVG